MSPSSHTLIEVALKASGQTHSVADVELSIATGEAQLWAHKGSLIVTRIERTPQRSVLHFWLAAGNLETLQKMVPAIEQWGAHEGCTASMIVGRRGWARSFLTKEQGWKESHVVLSKGL